MGNTYCISDIHGHYDNLINFINTLNQDDKVYVLGDVIDKGDKSIETLELIMKDDRFTMLLGNHEYMMFTYLYETDALNAKRLAYEAWVNYNDGGSTLDRFNNLPNFKKKRIFNYLKNLPINLPDVVVNGKKYYLVHSCPHNENSINIESSGYDDDKISSYVWDRVDITKEFDWEGSIVIAGHTPIQSYGVKRTSPLFIGKSPQTAKYIDIDGGLASDLNNSSLIALRLDDLSYKLY